MDIYRG